MVSAEELEQLLQLMNSRRYGVKSRRMVLLLNYDDVYVAAEAVRTPEGVTLVLHTEGGQQRTIPLSDLSRIDFMWGGNLRLMYLVDGSINIGYNTFISCKDEQDAAVLLVVN